MLDFFYNKFPFDEVWYHYLTENGGSSLPPGIGFSSVLDKNYMNVYQVIRIV